MSTFGNPDTAVYLLCMEEIKRRQIAIDDILSKKMSTSFQYTNVEFVALQYRKILELIILASLASNRALLDRALAEINNEWRIKNVIKRVEKVNPGFYPRPIIRVPSNKPNVVDEWLDKTSGFLTRGKLIEYFDKLGGLLHARSPYRPDVDLREFESMFGGLRENIIALLNNHTVMMPGGKVQLYVGMVSAETGAAHCAVFERLESDQHE